MRNLSPLPLERQAQKTQENPNANLSPDALKLLEVLTELEDFTINLRKKLMAELRPENEEKKPEIND